MFFRGKNQAAIVTAAIIVVLALAFFYSSQPQAIKPLARDALPSITFANLPPMPVDFFEKLSLFRSQKISLQEFANLGEEYWLQPETYPNFESYAINAMLNPPAGRWGAQGFGAFPSYFSGETKPGGTFETTVFFKTSWLVESYQGIRLDYKIDNLTQA